jgi:hypothetical protein
MRQRWWGDVAEVPNNDGCCMCLEPVLCRMFVAAPRGAMCRTACLIKCHDLF